jgi:plasmid stabilization system protein ParE
MRQVRHPFVDHDLIGIVDHILAVTDGNVAAARRRLDEIDDLLAAIGETPLSGTRLSGDLDGWLVRHGGVGQRLTIVFHPDVERDVLFVALVAFGGRDWMRVAAGRSEALR